MSRLVRLFALGAAAWLAAAGSLVAQGASFFSHKHDPKATICYVDKLTYTNDNASYYVGTVELWYAKDDKKSYISSTDSRLPKNITAGQTVDVDLDKFGLEDGMEVWLRLNIALGENKSCHKDGHKLIYKQNVGRSIHFNSGGTTKNNNRCEYAESIKNQCSSNPGTPR
jgi:hypothetical protein